MVNFALGGDGGMVQQQSTQTGQAPTVTIRGGGGTGSGSNAPTDNFQTSANVAMDGHNAQTGMATFNALNKLTSGMLDGAVKREQQKQYYQGMAEVAQGKSLADVEAEQPAWTQIFGPGASTQGAQAMSATVAMNKSQQTFMAAMPQLRAQSPDQVRQYLVDQAASVPSTGDPMVDAHVQAKLGEQFGSMLDTHMRQHLEYVQEQNKIGASNMVVSDADSYTSTLKANMDTPDSPTLVQERARALSNIGPLPGQTDDSYRQSFSGGLMAARERGNMAYVDLAMQSDFYKNSMPAEWKAGFEQQNESFRKQELLNGSKAGQTLYNNQSFLEANVKQGTTGFPAGPDGHTHLDAVFDKQDADYRTATGSSKVFWTADKRAAMHAQFDEGNNAQALAAARLTAGATKGQMEFNASTEKVRDALVNGDASRIAGYTLAEGAAVNATNKYYTDTMASHDPERIKNMFAQLAAVSSDEKLRPPALTGFLSTQVDSFLTNRGPLTEQQVKAASMMQTILGTPNGDAALVNYIGADKAAKIAGMLQVGVDVTDTKAVDGYRDLIANGGSGQPSTTEKTQMVSTINAMQPGSIMKMLGVQHELGQYDLDKGQLASIATSVAPQAARYAKAYHLPDDQAARMAMADFMKGAEFIPGAFVDHNSLVPRGQEFGPTVANATNGLIQPNTPAYLGAFKSVLNRNLTDSALMAGADSKNFNADDYVAADGKQLGNGLMLVHMRRTDNTGGITNVYVHAEDVAAEGTKHFDTFNRGKGKWRPDQMGWNAPAYEKWLENDRPENQTK